MSQIKPTTMQALTRAAIPIGLVVFGIGLAARASLGGDCAPRLVLSLIVGGVLFFAAGVMANRRWLLGQVKSRKFFANSNIWMSAFLGFVLLIVLNAIVGLSPQTQGWAVDCTRSRLHTLSQKTQNILQALKNEVSITILAGSGLVKTELVEIPIGDRVEQLVNLYRSGSRKIKAETIDYDYNRARVLQLKKQIGEAQADSLVVLCGANQVVIPFSDLVVLPDYFVGEEKLTQAIIRVTEPSQVRVFFVTGHGEMSTENNENKSLSRFATELRGENYLLDKRRIDSISREESQGAILVIAGPVAPYRPSEIDWLLRFLKEDKGKLLFLCKPRHLGGTIAGMERLLEEFRVQVMDDLTVFSAPARAGSNIPTPQVFIEYLEEHPITKGLENFLLAIAFASPVESSMPHLRSGPWTTNFISPYIVTPLIFSGQDAWGETRPDVFPSTCDPIREEKKRQSLAVAVQPSTRVATPYGTARASSGEGLRLVVIGSVNVAENETLAYYPGDRIFLMNCVHWLADREMKLGVPPQRADEQPIRWSSSIARMVLFVAVFGMPLATALSGGVIGWLRKRP